MGGCQRRTAGVAGVTYIKLGLRDDRVDLRHVLVEPTARRHGLGEGDHVLHEHVVHALLDKDTRAPAAHLSGMAAARTLSASAPHLK